MSYSSDIPGLQNQLPLSIEISKDPKDLRDEVNDLYQTIASATNNKIGGLYVPLEKINSQQYFSRTNTQKFRAVYRMVVDFGALPNATTKSVPHNIDWNDQYRLTQSYGAANDPISMIGLPIPNSDISLSVDQNNVNVTTVTDLTAYTDTIIVIEYTKEI